MNTEKKQYIAFGILVALGVVGRIALADFPNLAPITALAVFGAAFLPNRLMAYTIPVGAMFVSDAFIGFYDGIWLNYLAYAAVVACSLPFFANKVSTMRVVGATTVGSVVFFLVSNFGVWFSGVLNPSMALYPADLSGLAACFTAALAFYRDHPTILGDLLFTVVLFGGYYLYTSLQPQATTAR